MIRHRQGYSVTSEWSRKTAPRGLAELITQASALLDVIAFDVENVVPTRPIIFKRGVTA